MSRATVTLPADLAARLDTVAAEQGRTRGALIRDVLRRHLAVRDLQCTQEDIRPFAEAAGVFTDDDVFRVMAARR